MVVLSQAGRPQPSSSSGVRWGRCTSRHMDTARMGERWRPCRRRGCSSPPTSAYRTCACSPRRPTTWPAIGGSAWHRDVTLARGNKLSEVTQRGPKVAVPSAISYVRNRAPKTEHPAGCAWLDHKPLHSRRTVHHPSTCCSLNLSCTQYLPKYEHSIHNGPVYKC